MKKVFVFLSAVLLVSVSSCQKDTSEEFVQLDEIVCSRTVTVNSITKAGDAEPVELTFTAYYDVEDECVTSFIISSTNSDLDVAKLKEFISAKFEEENGFALENADLSEIVMTKAESENPTKECFNECLELNKGEGRGWCRAGCIMDSVTRMIASLTVEVAGLFKLPE